MTRRACTRAVDAGSLYLGAVLKRGRDHLEADRVVLALGSHSPKLLAPTGVHIPVYPVKGYSITVPVTDPAGAPESTIMDETHKVAVTRLGDRIRVGGTTELAGYDERLRPGRRATLAHVVSDFFPHGGDVAKASFWCGLRPMTPDRPPIVGPTKVDGLLLATGHGTLGWTMAAGTGRVVAGLVAGRRPAIEVSGVRTRMIAVRVDHRRLAARRTPALRTVTPAGPAQGEQAAQPRCAEARSGCRYFLQPDTARPVRRR